jgi:chlorophyll(ide) b reductase
MLAAQAAITAGNILSPGATAGSAISGSSFRLAARPAAPLRRAALARATPTMADAKLGVVITGGAAGVGWAYAVEFSKRGYPVVICDIKDTAAAVAAVRARVPDGAPVYGTQCDVSDSASVLALGEFAKEKLQTVGYWINNAGINGGRRAFVDVPIGMVEAVVKVNLLGVLLCTQVAVKLMHEQEGVEGHIFNTVGSGVKGGGTPGYAVYGATKRGLPQLTDSLVKELTVGVQGYERVPTKGIANCHTLSPGMVFTDLLLNDSTKELRKFPFGVLAAQPEEVAEDLIPKILATSGQGAKVEFLTTDRVLLKFVQRFLLGQKSQYIDDDGNVIKLPGAQYLENGVRALY